MRIFLFSTTLLGLWAAAVAAPIGFGSAIADSVERPEQAMGSLVLDRIAADYDLPLQSAQSPLFAGDMPAATSPVDLLSENAWPEAERPAPEYPPIGILAAGLGFFGLVGTVPLLLQRIGARRRPRRRRVKIEIRMMA